MDELRSLLREILPSLRFYWVPGNSEQEATVMRLERSLASDDDDDLQLTASHLHRLMSYYWRPEAANTGQAQMLKSLTAALEA